MRTKATFLVGFTVGYVLGSRAGRQRYEQIRRAAQALANNPAVQSTATQIQHQATDALSTAKDKAAGAIGDRLHDKRPSWASGSASTSGSREQGTVATEAGWAGSNGHVKP